MKQEERYNLSQKHKISSLADIRAFARNLLLDEGMDIDIVNISEEGVKIQSFKKLVKALYDLGFKEGSENYATIQGQKKKMENLGTMLTKHQRFSKYIAEQNLIKNIKK